MIIRDFAGTDLATMFRIHEANGLPPNCFPELYIKDPKTQHLIANPNFLVNQVVEIDSEPVMGGFIKLTSEAFLIVNHEKGTAEQRWEWLMALTSRVSDLAFARGLDEISAWIPPEILDSFEKRLEDLGFVRSPWVCFTKKLT